MTTRTALGAAVLSVGLLAACSAEDNANSTPSPSETTATPAATATQAPSATTSPEPGAPAFPANTLPDTENPSGGPLGVRSARAAAHAGYDRVVIELGGTTPGQPGWRVEYVTTPTSDGSGNPVAVQGSAFLRVLVTGVGYPGDTGVPEPSPRRFTSGGTRVLREVVLDGVYEGQYTAFLGLSGTKPFRVFRLSNPERVVIDIRHS